jgi:hypothetical protein
VVFIKIFRQVRFDIIFGGAVAPGLGAISMVKGMNQRALGKILADTSINRLFNPAEMVYLIEEIYRNAAHHPRATLGRRDLPGPAARYSRSLQK